MKKAAAEKWAPCIPIHAAPSSWCCAVTVQGGFYVIWFDLTYGRYPAHAFVRTWD